MNAAESSLLELRSGTIGQRETMIAGAIIPLLDRLHWERARAGDLLGLPTGIGCFDLATRGVHAGEIVQIGARSGVGKSAFMVQAAVENCRQGTPVLIFSLEMTREQILRRILSAVSGVSFPRVRDPKSATDGDMSAIQYAADKVTDWPLHVVDASGISGDVAPSQLISSRKPEFAQQAFTAAHALSGGTWNAQSAEANFKVASSPANVAFFGSAKSLTDKGGTLDQLANAAKDIPQSQIPVFNSVADAVQAASGTGPIAKYASLALGVADDYSKVMGGGTGSDSSRAQALQLVGAKQSPNQRAASIDGIRGAVQSQTNSRIGNNTVMQRMYGTPQAAAPAGGYVRIQASDGSRHDLPQSNLDKARQRDPGLKVVNQ